MDEQMIELAAKAMTDKRVELLAMRMGLPQSDIPGWAEYTDDGKADAREEVRAAHSVMAGKVAEPSLADEVRAIAEDSNYSNELIGIAVRNWFHRQDAHPKGME